jgi:hypothetical protein
MTNAMAAATVAAPILPQLSAQPAPPDSERPRPQAVEPIKPVAWPIVAPVLPSVQLQAPIVNPIEAPRIEPPRPIEWPIVRPMIDAVPPIATPALQADNEDRLSIIPRILDSAAAISRALTTGAASAAVVSAPAPAARPVERSPVTTARNGDTYVFHFNGVSGDPQDLEEKLLQVLEKIEREKRARGFHDED